jgi:hypothetical protein
MESDIAFGKIQSGNFGTSSTPETIKDVEYIDLSVSGTHTDYLEIRNGCFVIAFFGTSSGYKKIPAKYMPAYPVTIYPSTQLSCGAITLLPETYIDSGTEFVGYSTSANTYISPKDPYTKYFGEMQYRNWGGYNVDEYQNAINVGLKPFFWILSSKLDELIKVGEEYNDNSR